MFLAINYLSLGQGKSGIWIRKFSKKWEESRKQKDEKPLSPYQCLSVKGHIRYQTTVRCGFVEKNENSRLMIGKKCAICRKMRKFQSETPSLRKFFENWCIFASMHWTWRIFSDFSVFSLFLVQNIPRIPKSYRNFRKPASFVHSRVSTPHLTRKCTEVKNKKFWMIFKANFRLEREKSWNSCKKLSKKSDLWSLFTAVSNRFINSKSAKRLSKTASIRSLWQLGRSKTQNTVGHREPVSPGPLLVKFINFYLFGPSLFSSFQPILL